MAKYLDYLIVIICLFLLAIVFNVFFVSFSMIISGTSGLSIIISEYFLVEPAIVLAILHLIAIVFGYFYLNRKTIEKALIGLILFPLFVAFTSPVQVLVQDLPSNDFLVFIIFGALLSGIFTGFIYKLGFTYGGGGIFVRIINKYYGKTIGESGFYLNSAVIVFGGFVLGYEKVLYAILIIYISTYIQDRILLGDYANKLVMINTHHEKEVKDFLASIGLKGTSLKVTGCYSNEKGEMIMCYLNNSLYFKLKEGVREIDNKAFIFVTNAYSKENEKI